MAVWLPSRDLEGLFFTAINLGFLLPLFDEKGNSANHCKKD
jgi:hypothetical protein